MTVLRYVFQSSMMIISVVFHVFGGGYEGAVGRLGRRRHITARVFIGCIIGDVLKAVMQPRIRRP